MNDEAEGAAAPETAVTEAPIDGTVTASVASAADGQAVDAVDAWSAALVSAGVDAANATALATNCLREGYAQGQSAMLGSDVMADHAANLTAQLAAAEARVADLQEQNAILAEGHAVKLEPKPESLLERLEDDVIRVAEEAAYAVSNLIAPAQNRKPDDGIDAWRKRTGGLHRHPAAKVGA